MPGLECISWSVEKNEEEEGVAAENLAVQAGTGFGVVILQLRRRKTSLR